MTNCELESNTTVVDVTYLCNARCRYCKWGDKSTGDRSHRSLQEILLPEEVLKALGTQRLVLSGGEPLLNPQISEILAYYSKLVDELIIITNGYNLNRSGVNRLIASGVTGITVSLDSIHESEVFETRKTSAQLLTSLLERLNEISKMPRNFELGINAVVSHPTANWITVRDLLEYGSGLRVDFVKFQPIFDDGYVGRNSSQLVLSHVDSENLRTVAKMIDTIAHPLTNPSSFWQDLASLTLGEILPATSCGLGLGHSILTKDSLNICYWLDSSSFGSIDSINSLEAKRTRIDFERKKQVCKVGYHCFCTQNISHVWNKSD